MAEVHSQTVSDLCHEWVCSSTRVDQLLSDKKQRGRYYAVFVCDFATPYMELYLNILNEKSVRCCLLTKCSDNGLLIYASSLASETEIKMCIKLKSTNEICLLRYDKNKLKLVTYLSLCGQVLGHKTWVTTHGAVPTSPQPNSCLTNIGSYPESWPK
jgi:hypothetical protein